MRFLVVDTDYPEFLHSLYNHHSPLSEEPYERQMAVRTTNLFGIADFYASNLRKLGHEATDIYANNECAQRAWAAERDLPRPRSWFWQLRWRRGVVPWLSRIPNSGWMEEVLEAQVKHYRPDVLLNQAMDWISGDFLKKMKPHIRLLVGQIAAPLPRQDDWEVYDLVFSSLPNFVEHFRRLGIPSEFSRLGFEPKVLEHVGSQEKDIPVSFVGSLSQAHHQRLRLLERLCAELPIKVWGTRIDNVAQDSPIRNCYVGPAWGIQMYDILRRSKITVNHHIDIAGSYANNLRLYEATGVGTLLVTDWKENLHDMFEIGKEVVAYRSHEECKDLIRYYLEHDQEREAIAACGQQRTLREHTYHQRMQELVGIVSRYF